MGLTSVDARYAACSSVVVYRHIVTDSVVAEFNSRSRAADLGLSEVEEDARVKALLGRLRRIRWSVNTIPLATDSPDLGVAGNLDLLHQLRSSIGAGLGEHQGGLVARAVGAAQCLLEAPSSALLDAVVEDLEDCGDNEARVVIADQRMAGACRTALDARGAPFGLVLSHVQARDDDVHASQVVVGLARNSPDWLFTAPTANHTITLVHIDGWSDRTAIQAAFGTGREVIIRGPQPRALTGIGPEAVRGLGALEKPETDWEMVRNSLPRATEGHSLELVEARGYLLADGSCIFLEAEKGATCRTVRVGRDGKLSLTRTATASLSPGQHIVLRGDGGARDDIAEVADGILGVARDRVRRLQEAWTTALRRKVRMLGIDRVARDLAANGCRTKNVTGWCRFDTIRAQNPSDFRIILDYCGFDEAHSRQIVNEMSLIASAHLRAGQEIRRQLEGQLAQIDSSELLNAGSLELVIPDLDVRAMRVCRIDDVEAQSVLLDANHLNTPVEKEMLPWLT